jgi:hypothetical protein
MRPFGVQFECLMKDFKERTRKKKTRKTTWVAH